jgi:hypothetical protein
MNPSGEEMLHPPAQRTPIEVCEVAACSRARSAALPDVSCRDALRLSRQGRTFHFRLDVRTISIRSPPRRASMLRNKIVNE